MTCRDKVVTCIKAPRQSSTSFKVGLVLLPLNLILFLVSFSTDKWLESSTLYSIGGVNYTARHQGLWRYCQDTSGVECCGNLDDVIGLHSHSIPAHVDATRAFMTIGLIVQSACLMLLFSSVFCCQKQNADSGGRFLTTIACISTAVSVILSIIIYGAAHPSSDWTSQYHLSWSYAFAVISGVIYVVGAVIFTVDMCSD